MYTIVPFPYRAAWIFGVDKHLSTEKKIPKTKKRLPNSEWLWALFPAALGKLHHTQQGSRSVTPLWVWEGFTALHPPLRIPPCTSLLASPLSVKV